MRALHRPLFVALACLSCAWAASPRGARAEEVRPAAPAAPLGVEAAFVEAKSRDVPVLVLVGIERQTCPPVARVEDGLFAGASLERLRAVCVPARLTMGDPATLETFQRFTQRYGTPVQPVLFLLAADGDLLVKQLGGLYGVYDDDLTPLAAPPVRLLSEADVVALVESARSRDRQERARLAATETAGDAATLLERAEILAGRARKEEALLAARRAAGTAPAPEHGVRLARVFAQLDARAEGAAVLRALLAKHPAAKDALAWEVLSHVYGPAEAGPRTLADLAAAAEKAGSREAAALAHIHAALADETARAMLEVDPTPLDAWATALRDMPYEGTEALGRLTEVALGPRSRLRGLEVLLAHFPDSAAAQHGKHGMIGALRRRVNGR